MAIHPLLRTLASQPELLTEHAGAYLALASAELESAARIWRRRLLMQVLAAGLAALGIGLGGMAILLAAALPHEAMPTPWMLPALPLALVTAGTVLALWQRRLTGTLDLGALREQWALDLALWHEAAPS